MDSLDCRSPRRCPTCEHWLAGGCDLERQLAVLEAPRATRPSLAWAPPTPIPAPAVAAT